MAKSSRSSRIKKNNTNLKKRVFGPVEKARNERLSARLMKLAEQPKPPKAEMEIEEEGDAKDMEPGAKEADGIMEIDRVVKKRTGNGFRLERNEKQKQAKASRISKSTSHKKPRNQIVFAKTGKAKAKKGSKR